MKTVASCADCHYPIGISNSGQRISCPMCGVENEAISGAISQNISLPSWVLLAIGFLLVLKTKRGQAIGKVATVPGGSRWECYKCGKTLKAGEQVAKLGSKVYCAGCIKGASISRSQ